MVISNVQDYYRAVNNVCVPYYIKDGIRNKEAWVAYWVWEMKMMEEEAIREYQQYSSQENKAAMKAAIWQREMYEAILEWIDYAWGWSDM